MPAPGQFREDEVVDRAMMRFWRHGAEATSVQDLVDITGVNRASLYATWGDKRGLFLAALRRCARDIRQAGMEQAASHQPPLEAIRAILGVFVAQAGDPAGAPGCFLANTALPDAKFEALRAFTHYLVESRGNPGALGVLTVVTVGQPWRLPRAWQQDCWRCALHQARGTTLWPASPA